MASDSTVAAAATSAETSIHLYAEHLLHIRALTLIATLSTHSTALTRAVLSADGSSLTLSHEDASATIVLPTQIQGGGDAALELPQQRAKELQLRLMLEEKADGFLEGPGPVVDEGNWVPWAAPELEGKCGEVRCGACGEALVRMGRKALGDKSLGSGDVGAEKIVVEWKDLPNENWAEMMDFWHCHKPPPVEEAEDDAADQKGYAAGNKLRASDGVGFVDLESFLFSEVDCEGVEVRSSEDNVPNSLVNESKLLVILASSHNRFLSIHKIHTGGKKAATSCAP
jgi:ubiquitin-protein ligase E3 D